MSSANGATGSASPLRWRSQTALAAIAARVDHIWGRWCSEWGLVTGDGDGSSVIAANAWDAPAAIPGVNWFAPSTQSPANFWALAFPAPPSSWTSALLWNEGIPAGTSDDGPVAAAVARIAMDDLRAGLRQLWMADSKIADEWKPVTILPSHVWSGQVLVSLPTRSKTGPMTTITLCLSCAAADLLDPAKAAPVPDSVEARVPIVHAIAARPFAISIELAGVELDLGALQSLQIGDVLALAQRLDEPLLARSRDGGAPLCSAFLGRRGRHKAVELHRLPAELTRKVQS